MLAGELEDLAAELDLETLRSHGKEILVGFPARKKAPRSRSARLAPLAVPGPMHAVDDVNETREVMRMAGDGEPPRVLDFLEGGRGGLHVTQDSPRFAGVSRREAGLHANSLQEQNTDAHLGCHSQEARLAGLSKAKFSKAVVMLSLVCA